MEEKIVRIEFDNLTTGSCYVHRCRDEVIRHIDIIKQMEESEGEANKNLKERSNCLDKAKDGHEKAKVTLEKAEIQLKETTDYDLTCRKRGEKITNYTNW
jgi:hypothetical protein